MGLKDWRTRHAMRDPVPGEFRVTGTYFAHPNGSSYREMLTGVVTGPGIAPTAGEHLTDESGRYIGHDVLPVLVDRSAPTKFVVLWDELPKPDFRAQARQQASQAADDARRGIPPTNSAPTPPRTEVYVDGVGVAGGSTPAWVTDMVADLSRQGLIPGAPGAPGGPSGPGRPTDDQLPVTVQLPDHVIDLTAGRVSAADAAHLIATGLPASAVLLAVTDVAVPAQALPGPTASLCDLTLRVTLADGASYDAVTRLGFRDAQRRSAIAVIGASLPVRIDPADRTRVVVDSVTFDATH